MRKPSSRRYRLHRILRLGRLCAEAANNTSGAVAVEFGFIIPVLAFMVVAVADIGMGVYRKMQVENAAQAGVEYAIVHGFDVYAISNAVISATNSTIITAVPAPTSFCGCATGSAISTASCGATCPGGASAANYTTASAQATYSTIMNYPYLPSTYTFSKQSTARLK